MARIGVFMADGCEEIEALTVVDVLRRAGFELDMIGVEKDPMVTGSHNISFMTDVFIGDADLDSYDGVVLPGGMPGTLHLGNTQEVINTVRSYAAAGKLVSAICAAPTVLCRAGILQGKHATSYPGSEGQMPGALYETESVVKDGNIITSRGMGTAIPFALEIIKYFMGAAAAAKMADSIVYRI